MTARSFLVDDARNLPFPYLYDLQAPDADRLRDLVEVLGIAGLPEAEPGHYYSGATLRARLDPDGRLTVHDEAPYPLDQGDVDHLARQLARRQEDRP